MRIRSIIRSIIVGTIATAVGVIVLERNVAHASPVGRVLAAVDAHQAVDGKEIYLKSCKECHGVLGAPTKAALRKYDKIGNFTDPEFFAKRKEAELIESVEKGKGRDMKGFAEKLSKEEIKAVVAYIQTLQKK